MAIGPACVPEAPGHSAGASTLTAGVVQGRIEGGSKTNRVLFESVRGRILAIVIHSKILSPFSQPWVFWFTLALYQFGIGLELDPLKVLAAYKKIFLQPDLLVESPPTTIASGHCSLCQWSWVKSVGHMLSVTWSGIALQCWILANLSQPLKSCTHLGH